MPADIDAAPVLALWGDLPDAVRDAVGPAARPVVADLARSIASASGPSAYARVYSALAAGISLRPAGDQPPEIVVSGGRLSGGGSVGALVWPYEYGTGGGDTSRRSQRGRPHQRGAGRRGSQFPPSRSSGWWIGPVLDQRQGGVYDALTVRIDKAIDGAG